MVDLAQSQHEQAQFWLSRFEPAPQATFALGKDAHVRFADVANTVGSTLRSDPSRLGSIAKHRNSFVSSMRGPNKGDRADAVFPLPPLVAPKCKGEQELLAASFKEEMDSQLKRLRGRGFRGEREQLRKLQAAADGLPRSQSAAQCGPRSGEALRTRKFEPVQPQGATSAAAAPERLLRSCSMPAGLAGSDPSSSSSSPMKKRADAQAHVESKELLPPATPDDGNAFWDSTKPFPASAATTAGISQSTRFSGGFSSTNWTDSFCDSFEEEHADDTVGSRGPSKLSDFRRTCPRSDTDEAAEQFDNSSSSASSSHKVAVADAECRTDVRSHSREDSTDGLSRLEEIRNLVRRELLVKAGGTASECFNILDTNGSGRVSLQDFAPGVERIGVDWRKLTGLYWERHLFSLFDQNKDGVLHYRTVFPEAGPRTEAQERPGTADFWLNWCHNTRPEVEFVRRGPRWHIAPDERMANTMASSDRNEDISKQRKWMRSTVQRLKRRGKSDAKCRELVASHLPSGTGPKDRDGVKTFSQTDVRKCVTKYSEDENESSKRVQRFVHDMRDQRRVLQGFRQELYNVAIAPHVRMQAEEDRRNQAKSLAGGPSLKKFGEGDDQLGLGLGASGIFEFKEKEASDVWE